MNKLCLIVTNSHASFAVLLRPAAFLALACTLATAQDQEKESTKDAVTNEAPAAVMYPRDVAVDGDALLVVDLDLPGIWRIEGDKQTLYVRGTKFLRKPMNRPWCVVPHPAGGILVGDSATREIYAFPKPSEDGEPLASDSGKPLNDGYVGIPMAMAVSPDGKTIYVGDAEKRAVFSLPIEGGKPALVARVNARGMSFDDKGNLWAVTPDAEAVYRIDVKAKKADAIVKDRPYQFPGGLTWSGDEGFVSDVYGKSIWRFTADGKTEKWFDGKELSKPVGLASDGTFVYVTDADKKQTFQIDRKTKEIKSRMN